MAGALTTEQYAQRCLDLRGYFVVGTLVPYLTIGEITNLDDQPGTATDTKAVVIARTNKQDLVEQLICMGEIHLIREVNTKYFYRLIAE